MFERLSTQDSSGHHSSPISPSVISHQSSVITPSLITHQSITYHPSVHHSSPITPSVISHHPSLHQSSHITPSHITHHSITHHQSLHHSSPITPSLITHNSITHHPSLPSLITHHPLTWVHQESGCRHGLGSPLPHTHTHLAHGCSKLRDRACCPTYLGVSGCRHSPAPLSHQGMANASGWTRCRGCSRQQAVPQAV